MIRPYESRDRAGVLAVWREASLVAHPFLSDDFVSEESHAIEHIYLPKADTWVWASDGDVLGFVSILGNEIGGLFVKPTEHRRGIGMALVSHVRTLHPSIEVEVFGRNEIGRAFYAKAGFTVIAEGFDQRAGEPILRLRLMSMPNDGGAR